LNEAINSIIGIFSGIVGTGGKGVQNADNRYNNPVYTTESQVTPLVYVYLLIAVSLLLFSIYSVSRK
jgi:hypothetical protein